MLFTEKGFSKEYVFDFSEVYYRFCKAKTRYKIIKGSRASMKSTNVAAYILLRVIETKTLNAICLRKSYTSIVVSVYNQLKISARMLGVYDLFEWKRNPVMIIKKETGQTISFSGLKEPDSLASRVPEIGKVGIVWLEEAFEIKDELTWIQVEGTFRGVEGIEFILTFNPWNKCWLYEMFFKGRLEDNFTELEKKGYQMYEDDKFLIMTVNHRINRHLTDDDHFAYTRLRDSHPHIYNVVSLGGWGNVDQSVYNTITAENYITAHEAINIKYDNIFVGVDYALVNDATAISVMGLDRKSEKPRLVFLAEWKFSNSGRRLKVTGNEIVKMTIQELKKFCVRFPKLLHDKIVYVENQEGGGFKEMLKAEARRVGLSLVFRDCKKAPITERIMIYRYLFGENILLISDNCHDTAFEFRNSTYDLEKLKTANVFIRTDGNDDIINASEYALSGVWNYLISYYTKVGKRIYG